MSKSEYSDNDQLISICKLDKFNEYVIISHKLDCSDKKIIGKILKWVAIGWVVTLEDISGNKVKKTGLNTLQEAKEFARISYNDFKYLH